MERKEFLSKLGIGMALACAGCGIASCGSSPKNEDPQPQPGTPSTPGTSLVSADLNSELKNVGEFKVQSGVILVRLATANTAASFTAVQVACTHQGTAIAYNNAQGKFICPNHFSEFSTSGSVLKGPAASALKQYTVNLTGNSLTVTT